MRDVDAAEVPPVPWARDNRILAAFRYVEPPYGLKVSCERIHTEAGIEGHVREAALTTSFSPDGQRLTRAVYTVVPGNGAQFFEFQLPAKARLLVGARE